MNKLRRLFNPTPEEREEDAREFKKFIQQLIDERACCTCQHYEPAPEVPACCSSCSYCNMLNITSPQETCLFYVLNTDFGNIHENTDNRCRECGIILPAGTEDDLCDCCKDDRRDDDE